MALAMQNFSNDRNKKGTSQNGTISGKSTTSRTVNGVPVNNPSNTQSTFANKLRESTVNGSRINGAFNGGTVYPSSSPTVGEPVKGTSYSNYTSWANNNKPVTTTPTPKAEATPVATSVKRVGEVANPTPVVAPSVSDNTSINIDNSAELKAQEEARKRRDATLEKIIGLLNDQYDASLAKYKTQYENELANNRSAWENNRNQANLDYMRTDTALKNMYGDAVSGAGLSNRSRNMSSWNNKLSDIRSDYTNADANSLTAYNSNRSNAANVLAQGWSNYVMPIYTNEVANADNMDYTKWNSEQQRLYNRLMNQDDLNYRLQLASMGLLNT